MNHAKPPLPNGIGGDMRCDYLSNHGTFLMRLALVATAVNVLMSLTLGSTALADSREVKEAAPILRGVWTGQSVSKDMGKTVETINPIHLATVSATKFKGQTGVVSNIDKIVEVREPNAEPVYLLKLPDGAVWAVTQKKEPGFFMLQTMQGNPLQEVLRFGFTITPEKPPATQVDASKVTPRILRGVWMGQKVSKDLGKTVETIAPTRLATAYAITIRGQKGDLANIEKI